MLLSSDSLILKILTDEKNNGNELLSKFHIQHPSKRVAQESNSIFVACVSTENNLEGFEFSTFTDLVEILIVIKKLDYEKAIQAIKVVSTEICKVIYESLHLFPNKPVIRNINPEYNNDFVLNRGHILIEVNTEPIEFVVDKKEFNCVCDVLVDDIEVK